MTLNIKDAVIIALPLIKNLYVGAIEAAAAFRFSIVFGQLITMEPDYIIVFTSAIDRKTKVIARVKGTCNQTNCSLHIHKF